MTPALDIDAETVRPGHAIVQPNHNATPPAPTALYLGDPGDAIGRVSSATTNLDVGGRVAGAWIRNVRRGLLGGILAGVGVGAGALAGLGLEWLFGAIPVLVSPALQVLGGAAGVAAGVAAFPARPQTTYVGTEGLLRLTRKHDRAHVELLRFEQVAELRAQRIISYTNGVYTGTNFSFEFRADAPASRVLVSGGFQKKRATDLDAAHPIHFAQTAELLYTRWRAQRLDQELNAQGFVAFPIRRRETLRMGRDFVSLVGPRGEDRLERADVASFVLHGGAFEIRRKHRDARKRGGRRRRLVRVSAAQIGDFKLLLVTLELLWGVRF